MGRCVTLIWEEVQHFSLVLVTFQTCVYRVQVAGPRSVNSRIRHITDVTVSRQGHSDASCSPNKWTQKGGTRWLSNCQETHVDCMHAQGSYGSSIPPDSAVTFRVGESLRCHTTSAPEKSSPRALYTFIRLHEKGEYPLNLHNTNRLAPSIFRIWYNKIAVRSHHLDTKPLPKFRR